MRGQVPAPWPCTPWSHLSSYQHIVFGKSERQEQKVSTGFCFPQASARGLGLGWEGQWLLEAGSGPAPPLGSPLTVSTSLKRSPGSEGAQC